MASGARVETNRPPWSRGRVACGISCANASRASSRPSAMAGAPGVLLIALDDAGELDRDQVERPKPRRQLVLACAGVGQVHELVEPDVIERPVGVAERLIGKQGLGGVAELAPLAQVLDIVRAAA